MRGEEAQNKILRVLLAPVGKKFSSFISVVWFLDDDTNTQGIKKVAKHNEWGYSLIEIYHNNNLVLKCEKRVKSIADIKFAHLEKEWMNKILNIINIQLDKRSQEDKEEKEKNFYVEDDLIINKEQKIINKED